jgi:hypothetical protein
MFTFLMCFVLNAQRALVFKCPLNEEFHRFFLLLVYWNNFHFYNDCKTIWSEINLPFKTNWFAHHCPIKVQVFWKGHKNLKKMSNLFWHYWVIVKSSRIFFIILWPSYNVLTVLLPVLCCLKSDDRYLNLKSKNFLMQNKCLVHLLTQNLFWVYSNF